MNPNLLKPKTEIVLDELKRIKRILDSTKTRRPEHAYARACRDYNTILININDIPELDAEKREALKKFIEERKAEMPQELIKDEEEKYQKHVALRQELGIITLHEKRKANPEFFRSDISKTKEQMVLSVVHELELESELIGENNFMLKSPMTISDARLSFEYLLDNLNNMPNLTNEQIQKLRGRISNSISDITTRVKNGTIFEEAKEVFEQKSIWRKMLDVIIDKSTQPEKYINKYRQER